MDMIKFVFYARKRSGVVIFSVYSSRKQKNGFVII